jgi:hypothetical protein
LGGFGKIFLIGSKRLSFQAPYGIDHFPIADALARVLYCIHLGLGLALDVVGHGLPGINRIIKAAPGLLASVAPSFASSAALYIVLMLSSPAFLTVAIVSPPAFCSVRTVSAPAFWKVVSVSPPSCFTVRVAGPSLSTSCWIGSGNGIGVTGTGE